MNQPFISRTVYVLLFLLLGIIYIIGLFVPLMDNDSAHHATIAMHMYLTGDYVNLIDHGRDYLDKPHLHFWLSAASYHIFGVTSFAYKFPSFLFTIIGTYGTYRLATRLYNSDTGRLAALITASAVGYILANNDVRMDAILTASVIIATWQLVDWIETRRWINVAGAALGLALGFCTKGHIAVFTPGVGILFYLLYTRKWRVLFSAQFLSLLALFFVFISPVVYCYYLQFDQHPEKLIRGKSGRSGVAFILWQQNFERFQGDSFGADAKNDRFFFLHSFLWAFAPWSIVAFTAFFSRIRSFSSRQWEWLTIGTFLVLGLLISFSGFKLPHYLNIIFPVSAVMTAAYLINKKDREKTIKRLWVVQVVLCSLVLAAAFVINLWIFPATGLRTWAGFAILLAVLIFLLRRSRNRWQKMIILSAAVSILAFYLMNTNFYRHLLSYQGGNTLALSTRAQLDPQTVYYWPGIYSSSYDFYTAYQHQEFHDSLLQSNGPLWILTTDEAHIRDRGIPILQKIETPDYEITMLKPKFLNPATREGELKKLMLLKVK